MKPLFKDPSLQEEMNRNGYVVARLLNAAQIRGLRRLYDKSIAQTAVSDLYESSRHNSLEANQRISQAIHAALADAAPPIFAPCRLYGGTFMVKSCQDSTVLPLHQDWSVVEEDEYSTFFIWCPLQEVNAFNGGLFVLEGSHKYFNAIRSGTYPSDRFILPYELRHCTRNISLKAGEAVIYSDRLFHGSHPNQSAADRVVVTGRVVEPEARLLYFHKKSQEEVDVYKADPAFYLSQIDALAKGQPPSGLVKLYTRAYRHEPPIAETLRAKIKAHLPPPERSNVECRLFKDAALQAAFDQNGYVVIDLIERAQVEELLAFYHSLEHAPMPEYGFQVSLDNTRPEFVRKIAEKLKQTVQPYVEQQFQDYQIFTASFVVKEKNPLGVVPPHQDWTFVDEQRYWSATIWCPLIDVDMHNGGLGVIQGSHHFYDHVRPSPSPQYAPPFKDQLFSIFPYLKLVELKAGQALVFNNRTLHASLPNVTEQNRISFGLGLTHRSAGIQHFYLLPNREKVLVERYEVKPDFFCAYNNARLSAMYEAGDKPHDLNSTGLFEYTCEHYDAPQLVELIEAAGNVRNDALIQEMADLFNYNLDGTAKDGTGAELPEPPARNSLPWWKIYTATNICREIQHRVSRPRGDEPLWQVYTPARIVKELKHRLAKG